MLARSLKDDEGDELLPQRQAEIQPETFGVSKMSNSSAFSSRGNILHREPPWVPQALSHRALPRKASLGCILSWLLLLGVHLCTKTSILQLTASPCLHTMMR